MRRTITVCVLLLLAFPIAVMAGGDGEAAAGAPRVLKINSNQSDPVIKQSVAELVQKFDEEHPDITVELTVFDHEAYKTNIRNFLASEAPDIAFWFAGNRMKFFVDQGLFADISDVWEENDLKTAMASSLASLTIDGKQYGFPMYYYQWGVYYRKDIFDSYGLSEPETWDEFLAICATLKSNGITPITIGTKFLWTAGGWFDYLNLRTNGYDFHIDLTDGNVSYEDSRLDAVFDNWRVLVENGYYLENHATYSWQEAQAPLINGTAAMYLIGNFIVPDLERAGVKDNIDFFQFPIIVPGVPVAEDAPIDTLHIPEKAKNKEDAKRFLAYLTNPENGRYLTVGTLSPNSNSPPPEDRFLVEGFNMLNNATALAQFYDRDTDPEMASTGMEGFQQFMVDPSKEAEIRARLERERKSVFGK